MKLFKIKGRKNKRMISHAEFNSQIIHRFYWNTKLSFCYPHICFTSWINSFLVFSVQILPLLIESCFRMPFTYSFCFTGIVHPLWPFHYSLFYLLISCLLFRYVYFNALQGEGGIKYLVYLWIDQRCGSSFPFIVCFSPHRSPFLHFILITTGSWRKLAESVQVTHSQSTDLPWQSRD